MKMMHACLKTLAILLLTSSMVMAAHHINDAEIHTFSHQCSDLGSTLVTPSTAHEYRKAVRLFLDLFTWRNPSMVLYAYNEDSVVAAVQFAKKHNMQLSVRSGGNSNLGWGTCDGCLVVDVSNMTALSIDQPNMQVTAQPGVNNRMLVDSVDSHGLAVPQGDCPMVCMGGYAVGGGLALTARSLGMNIDAAIEFRVVGADGKVHVASASSNPDLFWGLRGGSGINLGIVTQLKYQAKPMPPKIIGGHLSFQLNTTVAEEVADVFYDYVWGTDPATGRKEDYRAWGLSLGWVPDDTNPMLTSFKVMGLWFSNDTDKGNEILNRFKALPGFVNDHMKTGNFTWVMQPLMDQYLGFYNLNWTMPDAMIKVPTDKADFKNFASTVTASALKCPASTMLAWVFAPQGGAIDDHASDAMAYPHRNVGANLHMPTIWFDPQFAETSRMFGQEALYRMRPWWVPSVNTSSKDPSSYVNHPSQYLDDYHHAYWGNNLPRLQQIKKKYDPTNFMRNGQGIPSISSGSDDDNCDDECKILVGFISAVIGALIAVGIFWAASRSGSCNSDKEITASAPDRRPSWDVRKPPTMGAEGTPTIQL